MNVNLLWLLRHRGIPKNCETDELARKKKPGLNIINALKTCNKIIEIMILNHQISNLLCLIFLQLMRNYKTHIILNQPFFYFIKNFSCHKSNNCRDIWEKQVFYLKVFIFYCETFPEIKL